MTPRISRVSSFWDVCAGCHRGIRARSPDSFQSSTSWRVLPYVRPDVQPDAEPDINFGSMLWSLACPLRLFLRGRALCWCAGCRLETSLTGIQFIPEGPGHFIGSSCTNHLFRRVSHIPGLFSSQHHPSTCHDPAHFYMHIFT